MVQNKKDSYYFAWVVQTSTDKILSLYNFYEYATEKKNIRYKKLKPHEFKKENKL
jgi:hypothetical protein